MKYKLISSLKSSISKSLSYNFDINNNLLNSDNEYSSFLLNYNVNDSNDIQSMLLPYQASVVIFIFSIFGVLRYKISKSSSIRENIVKIKDDIKKMKILILSNNDDNSIKSDDIFKKELYLKQLYEEFNNAKTVLKFNNYQLNIPVAAIGGDINISDDDNKQNISERKDIQDGSQLAVSSFTQLIRLVFGIIVLYGLVFILYLLNFPDANIGN